MEIRQIGTFLFVADTPYGLVSYLDQIFCSRSPMQHTGG